MHATRLLVATACVVAAACGSDGSGRGDAATAADGSMSGLTVVAASSLTAAFGEIATAFQSANEGVQVDLSFDGSARLATALVEGAPADVFASADEANLAKVVDEDLTSGDAVTFATNVLQIVVAEGNPLGIDALDDLTDPDVILSLCGPEVPCGRYAAQAFETADLDVPPAGDQENVKGVLTQVQLGEADAGIVYVTDVLAADAVEGIDLPSDQRVVARYSAAALVDASEPDTAAAFLAFLTGDQAQGILQRFGFGPP